MASRPFVGRSRICVSFNVVPAVLVVVSTLVTVPVTSTFSVEAATFRDRSTRAVAPTFSTNGWVVVLPNWLAETETT